MGKHSIGVDVIGIIATDKVVGSPFVFPFLANQTGDIARIADSAVECGGEDQTSTVLPATSETAYEAAHGIAVRKPIEQEVSARSRPGIRVLKNRWGMLDGKELRGRRIEELSYSQGSRSFALVSAASLVSLVARFQSMGGRLWRTGYR